MTTCHNGTNWYGLNPGDEIYVERVMSDGHIINQNFRNRLYYKPEEWPYSTKIQPKQLENGLIDFDSLQIGQIIDVEVNFWIKILQLCLFA